MFQLLNLQICIILNYSKICITLLINLDFRKFNHIPKTICIESLKNKLAKERKPNELKYICVKKRKICFEKSQKYISNFFGLKQNHVYTTRKPNIQIGSIWYPILNTPTRSEQKIIGQKKPTSSVFC